MTPKPTTPRAAKLLTIDLGADLKASWFQWCAERQLVPGKALKRLIETALREGLEAPNPPVLPGPVVKVGTKPDAHSKIVNKAYKAPYSDKERVTRSLIQPKVEVRVSFTVSEHEALVAVATAQGFGVQEFVIAAVRAALAQTPSYGQAELQALTLSNATLVKVVTALVAFKTSPADTANATQFESLENAVRSHIEQVSRLMAVGARRWQLKV